MRSLFLIHLMILISSMTGLASHHVCRGVATKWPQFSNKVIKTNKLSVTENVGSKQDCLWMCLEMQICVSVFYRKVFRRCQFHDVLFLSPQDGVVESGTEYYSITTGSCPSGYVHARFLGLCYRLSLHKANNEDSVADCASRGEHLIVIDSQDFVKKLQTSSSDIMERSYFIDGSDEAIEGQWVYHDGRPLTYHAWAPGRPSNRYRLSLHKANNEDSVADCASRGEHLIVIDSQDFVKKLQTSSSDIMERSYFIDGSDEAIEGQWVYHDGRPLTYHAWAPGRPSNRTLHDYQVIRQLDFLWVDKPKTFKKYYICEKDM